VRAGREEHDGVEDAAASVGRRRHLLNDARGSPSLRHGRVGEREAREHAHREPGPEVPVDHAALTETGTLVIDETTITLHATSAEQSVRD